MKKIPLRKCIATQEQLPKKELLRIVRTPEGSVKSIATSPDGRFIAYSLSSVGNPKKCKGTVNNEQNNCTLINQERNKTTRKKETNKRQRKTATIGTFWAVVEYRHPWQLAR